MHAPRTALPKLADRLPLGGSGLEVSPFCIGAVEDPDVIPAAFEAGINFFFVTADMHWPLYEKTRRGLKKLLVDTPSARDKIVVGVTTYVTQPEFQIAPFEEVLEEVPELDHIDVTISGGTYGYDIQRRFPIFEQHRATGHVGSRAIGASFHDRAAALVELEKGVLDIAFVRYSPVHPRAREAVFEKVSSRADGRKTLLFNFKSTNGCLWDDEAYEKLGIGAGFWRPHVTDYYRFALTEPALDGILCAMPAPFAIRELSDALAKGPLTEEDRQYMLDLADLSRGRAQLNT
jgi:hypothetical protein